MTLANNDALTIARLAPLIRRKKLSPVELFEFVLDRIETFGPGLNAFITVTADRAFAQAQQAEKEIAKGHYRSPLHGIPISLKDLFYTAGIPTTAGSKILRDFVPVENAAVVDRLRDAGAVLVGKTNLHEFAFGATNVNPHYGPARNPWDPSRVSGGSSGGSAITVVAGLAVASLGTDTGGSIRIPAAACGCVGLKPSYGRVPMHGVVPLARSLDHVGPLCRCVEDSAIMLGMIAGADPRDATSWGNPDTAFSKEVRRGMQGIRIGIPRQFFFERLQSQVRRAVLAAVAVLEENGAEIHEVTLKGMEETADLAAWITVAEALTFHWTWLEKRPQDYGDDLRTRLEGSKYMTAAAYVQAQERRRAYADRLIQALKSVDLLVAPSLPVTAPRIGENEVKIGRTREDTRLALLRLTRPGNLAGLPAISVPCGFSSDGLPVGLQIIGGPREESTVLRVAYHYEQATSWHRAFPPL